MNRPILIAGTFCAALFFCLALPAADDNKSDSAPSSANSVNDSNAALFDRLDANHDGQITADEVPEEHRGLFDASAACADRNGDGKLSREEFMQGLADDQPGRPATRPSESPAGRMDPMRESAKIREYAASIIKQYDTNGDGVLDKTEWSKLKNAERYDRNHDGKITLEEIIETIDAHRSPGLKIRVAPVASGCQWTAGWEAVATADRSRRRIRRRRWWHGRRRCRTVHGNRLVSSIGYE